ncbi:hypothetical protein QTP86_017183, partial [Hemibagrus guttatus]
NTSPTMSPADLQAALLCQDAIIHTYQDQIEALQAKNLQLQQQSQTSTPPLPHLRESQKMALLEKFDGSTDCCQGFEHQCNIIFAHQPKLYVADTTRQHNLYMKLEKCEFYHKSLTFLGYVFFPEGVEMDQAKVKAVIDWPEPTSVTELQCFLEFTNFYRRFIQNYNTIAGPLTSLLRGKPRRLSWTKPAQEMFTKLKQSFTTAPSSVTQTPRSPL